MAELIKSSDVETKESGPTGGTPTFGAPKPAPTANPPTPTQTAFNNRTASTPKGSGFTNISKIVQANQNNRLGQTVTGGIRQNVDQAQQGINRAQQNFQQGAEQNRIGTAEQEQQRQGFLNRAAGGSVTAEDIANSQKFLSGEYGGPQGLENADALTGQARNAQALAGQVGTAGGRQALLQRFVGGGGPYTGGQQRLDTLLLGQTAAPALQQARREGQGLLQQATTAEQAAQGTAKQLGLQAQQFGQETGQLLGAQETGLQGEIGNQLKAAQDAETKRQEQFSTLRNQLGDVVNQKDPTQITNALQAAKDQGLIDEATFNDLSMRSNLLGGADKSDLNKKYEQASTSAKHFERIAGMLSDPTAKDSLGQNIASQGWMQLANLDPKVLKSLQNKNPNEQFKILTELSNRRSEDAKLYKGLQGTSQADLAQQLLSGLTETGAQNLSAQGLADQQQRARANALSALRGQGTVIAEDTPVFTQGSTAFSPKQFQESESNALLNKILGQEGITSNNKAPLTTLEYLRKKAGII